MEGKFKMKESRFLISMILFSVVLFQFSCEKQSEDSTVRLVINSEVDPEGNFDEIEVIFSATRNDETTGEYAWCSPGEKSFSIASRSDVPVIVYYVFGSVYNSSFYYRILLKSGGVKVNMKEGIVPGNFKGTKDVVVTFEENCFWKTCSDVEMCENGECIRFGQETPFDQGQVIDEGISCVKNYK